MSLTGFDPARNFAIADLASGITSGATSATLATGKGALFPDPSADGAFNTVIYNSTDYTSPWEDPDAEIVRVTARSMDTLTITRAQEGTSAVAHNTGGKTYSLYMAFTQKPYDDLVTAAVSASLPYVLPTGAAPVCNQWTDTVAYIPYVTGTTLTIFKYAINIAPARVYNGTTLQSINATSIQATANAALGVVVVDGYVYFLFRLTGTTLWMYRADITTDISNSANWTAITLSGANLVVANSLQLIGYGNGSFWFTDDTNNVYVPATLSGTTLTQGTTITVTGADYEIPSSVNAQGILASFSSAPFLRLADFSGTLQTNKTLNNATSTRVYSIGDAFYIRDGTSSTYYKSTP